MKNGDGAGDVCVSFLGFKWQKDRKYSLAQYNNGTKMWSVDFEYAINFNVIYLQGTIAAPKHMQSNNICL